MPGSSADSVPSHDAEALTEAEAMEVFRPLAEVDALALAVSGGPDSVALMHFAAACAATARRRGAPFPRLAVATVDHGLRSGARREAEDVVARAAALGLDALLLTWQGEKPVTRLQEKARHHRYALLVDGARRLGASHVATAHTLDDQAETLLFRMARGSGPAGLAGMRRTTMREGLHHVRPFLGIAKARLVAACRANQWAYAEDPSNLDSRFARTRWRALLPVLEAEGLDARRFGVLARRLAEADEVIAEASRRALLDARLEPSDTASFRAARLMGEPVAVLYRAIESILADRSRPDPQRRRGPRLERIEALGMALRNAWREERPFRQTLHGMVVSYDGTMTLTIAPEKPRRPPSFRGVDSL